MSIVTSEIIELLICHDLFVILKQTLNNCRLADLNVKQKMSAISKDVLKCTHNMLSFLSLSLLLNTVH